MRPTNDHFDSPEVAREEALAALTPIRIVPTSPHWDAFVRVMRYLLPTAAITLAALIIAWPSINETEVSFTLSEDEVARSDGVIRMTNPRYVGTDAIDRLFRIRAAAGQQDDPNDNRIRLTDIFAEMELGPDPAKPATVTARTGIYRMNDATLSLLGGVEVKGQDGLTLNLSGAEVDLKAHTATGQGTITGMSDLGKIEAGEMEIRVDEREGSFDGGVRLHIIPRRPGGSTLPDDDDRNEEPA